MDVAWLSREGIERSGPADLGSLLVREDGFAWVDIPQCDGEAVTLLNDLFGFHPIAVRDCLQRSHVPKVHGYGDHMFLVLHSAEPGEAGHVHLLELDQFIGEKYLITVHGPLGEGVELDSALRETRAVRRRIEEGRFRPRRPNELSHGIVSAITRRLEGMMSELATKVATLERKVMKERVGDPEAVLEELFLLRHELLVIRTMAAQGREAFARIASLTRLVPPEAMPLVLDNLEQFDRLRSLCNEEKDFLQGVVDFYQSRTTTKMNIAMERLALIAAVLLPITAVASVYGMNLIVSGATRIGHLLAVIALMGVITLLMLRWTKRQGWW